MGECPSYSLAMLEEGGEVPFTGFFAILFSSYFLLKILGNIISIVLTSLLSNRTHNDLYSLFMSQASL